MGITQKFIDMLGADGEQLKILIENLSEREAKDMLKIIIEKMNQERHGIDFTVK